MSNGSMPSATASVDCAEASDLPLLVVHHPTALRSRLARRWPLIGRTLLAILLLAAAGVLGTAGVPRNWFAKDKQAVSAKMTTSPNSVFALGRLEPRGEVVSVAAPNNAGESRVAVLRVQEGDQVQSGDVLAVLDNEARLTAALQVAVETTAQARLTINRTELEVATMRAQLSAGLKSAESRLANAQLQLKRIQQLAQSNASTREELELQQLEVTTSENGVLEAQAKLARYTAVDDAELIDITLSRQQLATAAAAERQARANLEQAFVHAPMEGTVLRLNLRCGERIGQQPLLEMGATHQMMSRVEVYESDIPRIALGQAVKITASPLAAPLDGTVERMMQIVQRQAIVDATPAANTDARIMEVWVRLTESSSVVAANFVNLQVRVEFLP